MNFWSILFVILVEMTYFADCKIKMINGTDPGSCSKKNEGEVLLVRDRQQKQKLLLCTKDKGVFRWRMVDGSSPPGEMFNPGYDCSDILDKDSKAKDGFYWIKFKSSLPKKVWCDMTTDGGGFMLIGRKNSSVTWTVPSRNSPVKPFGDPHWSSALGEAPILDFRVQMATSEDFKATKAHWMFRLQSKRKLKNLMIINKGGCGRTSPGIGNIAYVKDLQTDDIVTTSFRCSKFGIGYHPKTNFGWNMMNLCLRKPCPWGFAFHQKFRAQTDYSGAFSYRVMSNISGIEHPSTAFVGCDNGYCCGCYGPKGGKRDYCTKECSSKNGGTIKTNIYTWFWVRSSLPKRTWSKCMDYQVTTDGGDVWYKFVGGSELPIKGRCSNHEALLYDGILVVPDNVTANKVPSVVGIIEYRKDKKQLYVRVNKTWNEIAQKKEILNILKKDITQLENQIWQNHHDDFSSSLTLVGKKGYRDQLKQWLPARTSWWLAYRASEDGWRSSDFHFQCDYKGPTVTIIRVGSYIFGGYADSSWGGSARYIYSSNSFIFSLKNKDNLKPFKTPVYRNSGNAIYTNNGYGPTFGGGHDLHIVNNAHTSTSSYSNLGHTYRPPSGYSYSQANTRALLAGSYNFKPSEIEVYYSR